jgi:lactate racemase
MSEQQVTLPWGTEELRLALPADWRVAGVLEPAAWPGVPDPAAEVRRSLAEPIGMARLAALARPGTRVALLVDDSSRPTPVHLIAPLVVAELVASGVHREDITLVVALGQHCPMTEAELVARVGEGVVSGGVRWENHDCDSPELVELGATSRGTAVLLNKTVAGADLVVSIGCIEPHLIASFGGGYKNLFPGVAGRSTITHNHGLNTAPGTYNNVGRPVEHNPMRLDLEEAGRLVKAPVFIVNAVTNDRLQIVRMVAGDAVAAHREGMKTSAAVFGVRIPCLADLVIANSRPMDKDFRQGLKALANTIRAMKPGGVMLTLLRADEGVGLFQLADRKLMGRRPLQVLAPLLLQVVPRLKLKNMSDENRFFLYFALQAMRRGQLLGYAPTLPAEKKANLPFMLFPESPSAAIQAARLRLPRHPDVLIFPYGGSTYPIL